MNGSANRRWCPDAADAFAPLTAALDRSLRIAVIGAGAVGLTAAHDLAVGGADVTVFERDTVAAGATGAAAGLCYDAYAEDVDAAIGARALARFRALDGRGPFRFHEVPYVMLAHEGDEENVAAIETGVPRMRSHGRDVSLLEPSELGERYSLHSADLATAAVARNAGWVKPSDYAELLASLATSEGVTIEEGTPAELSTEPPAVIAGGKRHSFDAVIVAAGARTASLLAAAGLAVPIKAYRAQAMVGRGAYDGPMCFDATEHCYFRPAQSGVLAGDGVRPVEADPTDWVADADRSVVESLREDLTARTGAEFVVARSWAGLCTATPDGDPLVGELANGVYVAAGWQGHGFMRAPAIGEVVAAKVLGAADRLVDPLGGAHDPFEPKRFDGDEEFDPVRGMATEES